MTVKNACYREIVTKYTLFPKYIYDAGSSEIVSVWGKYYEVRHYYYRQTYDCEYVRRIDNLLTFVSINAAKKYLEKESGS